MPLTAFFQITRHARALHVMPLVAVHASHDRDDVVYRPVEWMRLTGRLPHQPRTIALPHANLALIRIAISHLCNRYRWVVRHSCFPASLPRIASPPALELCSHASVHAVSIPVALHAAVLPFIV